METVFSLLLAAEVASRPASATAAIEVLGVIVPVAPDGTGASACGEYSRVAIASLAHLGERGFGLSTGCVGPCADPVK